MFAAYTDDTIWSVEETEEEARSEGEEMMREMGAEGRIGELKVAAIDDDLVDALEEAEESEEEVFFDLIDGVLCEVEPVDEAEGEAA